MPLEEEVTSLILMRHGETAWNRERRVMGMADVPLNEAGEKQSRQAADLLAHFSVTDIISSPLRRASQTAEIVGGVLGIDCVFEQELCEVRFGRWQGLTYDEIRGDTQYLDFIKDPLGCPTPGGETIADVQSRALDSLKLARPGQTVLFVSHGDILRSVICHFLDIPLEEFRRVRVDNCGLSAITLVANRPEVKFVNVLADPERAWDPLHWSKPT
ncbi:MAG: histidine phosphatase family protein [Candidatus Binatia bacterium]